MGLFNKLTDMAKKKLKEDPALLAKGVEAVGDKFDQATGGKYAKHTDKAQDLAKQKLKGKPGQGQPPQH
ncbi:antitoxin [Pilimelia columellifera]|uniref:Antitoxin n=1 Tax=Pilimelia columellifera subsp. columellifera TaxID=706583 RepID=A0ABP6A8P3_9ACTN